jgi:membrane-bound lytic murein transglycosylase D
VLSRLGADTYALPPSFVRAVEGAVRAIAADPRSQDVYRREQQIWPALKSELLAQGLPEEMGYMPWVESSFDPLSLSSMGARGLWGFMPGTVRQHGLRVDGDVDERIDPAKSTAAAARLLRSLLAEMGGTESLLLAIESYNMGENKVRQLLRAAALEPGGWRPEHRDYFHLYRLKRFEYAEAAGYVPKMLAAMIVNGDPRRYGLLE